MDLKSILDLLCSTNDFNLQAKLISILATYVVEQNDPDMIITCKPLYYKLHNLLIQSSPSKTTACLNLITALLYTNEDNVLSRRTSLAIFARNMIRVSGCLADMVNLFANTMMHEDTWLSLCRCLSTACRSSETNQSQCSHLIPICVQRCRQNNLEVLPLLQTLLYNHDRNVQLFLDCDGMKLFNTITIQDSSWLQLLDTVVQCSEQAAILLRQRGAATHLHNVVATHGMQSQEGQWATLIMYHMQTKTKGFIDLDKNDRNEKKEITLKTNNISAMDCTSNSVSERQRNKMSSSKIVNINKAIYQKSKKRKINQSSKKNSSKMSISNVSHKRTIPAHEGDNTDNLFQNIAEELFRFNQSPSKGLRNVRKTYLQPEVPKRGVQPNLFDNVQKMRQDYKQSCNTKDERNVVNETIKSKEVTFSFLLSQSFQENGKGNANVKSSVDVSGTARVIRVNDRSMQTAEYKRRDDSLIDAENFKPNFISTPKRARKWSHSTCISQINNTRRSVIGKHKTKSIRTPSTRKSSKESSQEVQELKRSISARFFNVINESCTTFVKSVKSIFGSKKNISVGNKMDYSMDRKMKTERSEIKPKRNGDCSYSFTNYMQKRDAMMEEDSSDEFNKFSAEGIPCETCDDTTALRKKLAHDQNLRETLKKLKMGINLYGCNFKKISRTMWPRDKCMTPLVLYNLYRKLILK